MNNKPLKLGVCIIVSVFLLSMPITVADTEYYSNCTILLVGNCNTVHTPLLWRLGLYIPIFRKNVFIATSNIEGEKINVVLKNDGSAFLFSEENASIRLGGARGIFYWAGNSPFMVNSSFIFLFGRAKDIWVTH